MTLALFNALAQDAKVFPGADEQTPSRAHYFSWINNAWEGLTEAQTLINLEFFKWLHDEYGMWPWTAMPLTPATSIRRANMARRKARGSGKSLSAGLVPLPKRPGHGLPARDVGGAGRVRRHAEGGTATDRDDD